MSDLPLFTLDDDDEHTLRLSDVDALFDGLDALATTSSPSSSESLHAAATAAAARPSVRRTGAGRKRAKDELASLRRHVAELEEQLRCLALTRTRPDSSKHALTKRAPASHGALQQQPCALQLWRRIASQQGTMRRGAEQENARLRGLLSAQVRLSRSLERMVHRHPDMMGVGAVSPLSLQVPRDRASRIYASLVERLDPLFLRVDVELLGAGFSVPAAPQRTCEGLVKTDAATGCPYVELRSSLVVPFAHDAASAGFWKLYNTPSTDSSGMYQTLEPTGELLRAEIVQKLRLRRAEAGFVGHLAVKRAVGSKRTVCVWSSVGESEGELFGSDRVRIRETGWGVIEEVAASSGGSPLTVITSIARMAPDALLGGDGDGDSDARRLQQHAATVADFALANFHANLEVTQQILEGVILASVLPL